MPTNRLEVDRLEKDWMLTDPHFQVPRENSPLHRCAQHIEHFLADHPQAAVVVAVAAGVLLGWLGKRK